MNLFRDPRWGRGQVRYENHTTVSLFLALFLPFLDSDRLPRQAHDVEQAQSKL
jgi:hypothetical protein